jgi:hypothetical protein
MHAPASSAPVHACWQVIFKHVRSVGGQCSGKVKLSKSEAEAERKREQLAKAAEARMARLQLVSQQQQLWCCLLQFEFLKSLKDLVLKQRAEPTFLSLHSVHSSDLTKS